MNSVIMGTGYLLVHVPDMVIHNGSTQTTERTLNPGSEYLEKLPQHIRSYGDAVAYPPNQTYIGNCTPEELAEVQQPWYEHGSADAQRFGKFGRKIGAAEQGAHDGFIGDDAWMGTQLREHGGRNGDGEVGQMAYRDRRMVEQHGQ